MFKLKDGAKKLFSKYIFDKNKALPNGNNDSKVSKSSDQSRHVTFLNNIVIENMKQHFEKFVKPSSHDKTQDKGR